MVKPTPSQQGTTQASYAQRARAPQALAILFLCLALLAPVQQTWAAKTTQHSTNNWWHPTYLIDWSVALGLAGGGLALSHLVPPIKREWSPSDNSLSMPLKTTPLPHPYPLLLGYGVPLLGIALAQIATPTKGSSRGRDFHHAVLGLTESFGLTMAISGMLQVTLGRLRPDWRARCKPEIESLRCTGDAHLIDEGRRSFPNQSTAFVFTGATFLALYMAGKMNVFDGWGAFWKLPLVLTPLAAATWFAVQRTVEHRAHMEDVLIGALIGIASASIGYAINFYSPFHKRAGQPHLRIAIAPILSPQHAGLAMQGQW